MISNLIPYLPEAITYQFAKRYVAGTNTNTALSIVESLNNDGYYVTIDILGEHTQEELTANNISDEYISLYEKINKQNLNCNISIEGFAT